MKALFVLLLSGCFFEAGPTETVLVRFPALPAAAEKILGVPVFRVSFAGSDGRIASVYSPPGQETLRTELSAEAAGPVTALPVYGGRDDIFLPAGGLYPEDVDARGELALTWADGFAADLLRRFGAAGLPLSEFNAGRFFREAVLRGAGNPWHLDESAILAALSTFAFRADKIKLRQTFPVELSLPAGVWLARNPLLPAAETGTDGICGFGELPPGYHRFYRTDGGRVDIFIRDSGIILYTESETW